MKRLVFNTENLNLIKEVLDKDISQSNKFYELEKLGFLLFDGGMGRKQRDALFIHKGTEEIKVQLESGFGAFNYARYAYFRA
jgi:hypothetical protein